MPSDIPFVMMMWILSIPHITSYIYVIGCLATDKYVQILYVKFRIIIIDNLDDI